MRWSKLAIVDKAQYLVKRYATANPFRIAAAIGVNIHFCELGTLKGMYAHIKRNRFIVINNTLDEHLQKIVCAHELGHDQFHREMLKNKWMHEFILYDMNKRPEYEANLFAAEILLPDEEIIEMSNDGLDIEQIARAIYSDVNLVALKLTTLAQKGHQFRQFDYKSDFLKK